MSKALPPSLILLCLSVCCLILACKTPKDAAYFQTLKRDTVLAATVTKNFDLKIRPGDQLSIGISSASPELSGQFATPAAATGNGSAGGFLVDKNGAIQLYKVGDLALAGLSRAEAKTKLETALQPYLKDPLVTVRFVNQRVTVLGAVGSPGVISLTDEQISLLEALAQSGDLSEEAKRTNILVIRQEGGVKTFTHLNLEDHSIFSSPYFYLQNEDVVYVEPEPKKEPAKTQQIISYALSGISILTLIISRIK